MEQGDLGLGFWSNALFNVPNFILGLLMWVCLGRFLLSFFVRPDSTNYIWRNFRWLTDPVIRATWLITPRFMVEGLMPLVAAFWLMVLRYVFYVVMRGLGLAPSLGSLPPA